MSVRYIYAGDYGQIIELEFIDVDTGRAANLKKYNNRQEIIFRCPEGCDHYIDANFVRNGANGLVEAVIPENFFDKKGVWNVRGRVFGPNKRLTTEWVEITVRL